MGSEIYLCPMKRVLDNFLNYSGKQSAIYIIYVRHINNSLYCKHGVTTL